MRKRLLAVLTVGVLMFGGVAHAENEAIYNPATGSLNIPKVTVGSDSYRVDMQQQGQGLDFGVINAVPSTSSSTSNVAIYDPGAGTVNIPTVNVGSDSYTVIMQQQGQGLNFTVTGATAVATGSVNSNIGGYWSIYAVGGSDDGKKIDDWNVTQNGDSFTVNDSCDANDTLQRQGSIVASSISMSWVRDSVTTTSTGEINGNTILGTYSSSNGRAGSLRAERVSSPECDFRGARSGAKYNVYGGDTLLAGSNWFDNCYHPENYGYVLLGTADTTATFTGSYKYYMIVTEMDYQIKIDTVEDSNGHYYSGAGYNGNAAGTANFSLNPGGTPDGIANLLLNAYGWGNSGCAGVFPFQDHSTTPASITVYLGN